MIRDISDPEHPLSLEQLNIVQVRAAVAVAFSADVLPGAASKAVCPVPTPSPQLSKIWVDDAASRVAVEFVPTIPHCRSRRATPPHPHLGPNITTAPRLSLSRVTALQRQHAHRPLHPHQAAGNARPQTTKSNASTTETAHTRTVFQPETPCFYDSVAAVLASAIQNQRQNIQGRSPSGKLRGECSILFSETNCYRKHRSTSN